MDKAGKFEKDYNAKYVGRRFKEFKDSYIDKLSIYAYCLWSDGADLNVCITIISKKALPDTFVTQQLTENFGYNDETLIVGEDLMLHRELMELHDKAYALESIIFEVARTDNIRSLDKMSKYQVAYINDLLTHTNKAWAEFFEKHENEFTNE